MHEPVLLQEFLADIDLQRRRAAPELGDPRLHQPAERLGVQPLLRRHKIERRALPHCTGHVAARLSSCLRRPGPI
ncbi:hypothetical protein ACGFSD_31760 [Streptomyces caniferus]|uniref:hypothetical protein n=1 Tax=Streptomyces caniferus TaxID=285557 RepID=UPI0033EB1523